MLSPLQKPLINVANIVIVANLEVITSYHHHWNKRGIKWGGQNAFRGWFVARKRDRSTPSGLQIIYFYFSFHFYFHFHFLFFSFISFSPSFLSQFSFHFHVFPRRHTTTPSTLEIISFPSYCFCLFFYGIPSFKSLNLSRLIKELEREWMIPPVTIPIFRHWVRHK